MRQKPVTGKGKQKQEEEEFTKNLVITFQTAFIEKMDDTVKVLEQAVPGRSVPRTEFIREAIKCLAHLPPEHLTALRQYAERTATTLPKLLQEAVELYIAHNRRKIDKAVKHE
jgi:hypothetical protein